MPVSTVKHVSLEELANNLAALLSQVRDEHISLVVEYATGEQLLIKPLSPTRQPARADAADHPRQTPPNQAPAREGMSSMAALYDLDPDSITPG